MRRENDTSASSGSGCAENCASHMRAFCCDEQAWHARQRTLRQARRLACVGARAAHACVRCRSAECVCERAMSACEERRAKLSCCTSWRLMAEPSEEESPMAPV
jgi:hypothetical protein